MDKQCPTCGFMGQFDICPNDQSPMESMVSMEFSQNQDLSVSIPVDEHKATDKEGILESDTPNGAPKLTGQTLSGRYELIEVLGVGGMGTVYRARQTSMNRSVAVKVLSPQFSQNPQMIRRFEKEARVVSKLSHPNTVSVFDYGQTDQALYLVMELLEGQTLKEFLKARGPLRPSVAVHLIRQIVRSLHQAHKVGIVHRDIKPANIFILNLNGDNQFAKVLDFGVAKLVQTSAEETVTQAGGIIGTPKYMAPEQAQAMEVDRRCDLYSVGVLLFEMLAGYAPFDGDNPIGILMDHAQAPIPEMPTPLAAETNYGQLGYIAWRCLQKHPDDRYADADALLNDIDDWQIKRAQAPESVNPPRLSDHRPLDIARNKPRKVLIPFILFVLIGAGIYWQLEQERQAAPPQPVVKTPPGLLKVATEAQIQVSSTPPAQLIRLSDGKQFGRTPQAVAIESKTRFKLSRLGYISEQFELTPESPVKQNIVLRLKPKTKPKRTPQPSRLKPKPVNEIGKPTTQKRPIEALGPSPPTKAIKARSKPDLTPLEME